MFHSKKKCSAKRTLVVALMISIISFTWLSHLLVSRRNRDYLAGLDGHGSYNDQMDSSREAWQRTYTVGGYKSPTPRPVRVISERPEHVAVEDDDNADDIAKEVDVVDNDDEDDDNADVDVKRGKAEVTGTSLQPSNDIIVSLTGVPNKHLRSNKYLRTVHCPGSKRTLTFKDGHMSRSDSDEVTLRKRRLHGEADVLIFAKAFPVSEWEQLIKNRKPGQIWLYTSAESAYSSSPTSSRTREVEFQFNVTFGYHSKSEVYSPFGEYLPFGGNFSKGADRNVWGAKPSDAAPVAWASSHCSHTYWNRTALVYHLSKFVDMEMYGSCGSHKIARNKTGSIIIQKHKFYLAFENSCCSEYITEKFWMALAEYEAVPIVIGATKSELLRLAPPNSFIHADDFKSAEDLASYIKEVAEDAKLYNKYHEWRNHGKVEVYHNSKVYPYWEDESACVLLRYLEANAWKGKPIVSKIDPYGPDWIGSCKACGTNEWIQTFGLSSYSLLQP